MQSSIQAKQQTLFSKQKSSTTFAQKSAPTQFGKERQYEQSVANHNPNTTTLPPSMRLGGGSSVQEQVKLGSSISMQSAPSQQRMINQPKMSIVNPPSHGSTIGNHGPQRNSSFFKPAPPAQQQPSMNYQMQNGAANPKTSQLQVAHRSNGLHGAMNVTKFNKNRKAPALSMSAGISNNGASLRGRTIMNMNTNGQNDFTITHNTSDQVEKPWGFKRQTVVMSAGAKLTSDAEMPMIPDMNKRNIMNLILLGSVTSSVGILGGAFAYFFYPASSGSSSGGLKALDANGDIVMQTAWLKEHPDGERKLVQGLKGDAHYLISKKDGLENYAINAVCTHLGCVVPWNKAENKYMCPCHGSQYNNTGKVIRGPAPLSLALAHVEIGDDDAVTLTPWTETDFRTGIPPWWK